jgi:hypothetical protein
MLNITSHICLQVNYEPRIFSLSHRLYAVGRTSRWRESIGSFVLDQAAQVGRRAEPEPVLKPVLRHWSHWKRAAAVTRQ